MTCVVSPGEGAARTERSAATHGYSREWRGRRREPPARRRPGPDRYLAAAYAYQVKFTPDDLLNGKLADISLLAR